MNERAWWKLSWPAVVAGLVMLAALLVKNLDGTRDAPQWGKISADWNFGWPMYCAAQPWSPLDRNDIIRSWLDPRLARVTFANKACIDVTIGLCLLAGTTWTIVRWQSKRVIDCRLTLRGMLAVTALVAANITLFMHSDDSLWAIKPIATGVVFVGIFLTCLAVIDWIGGLWSLITRRKGS